MESYLSKKNYHGCGLGYVDGTRALLASRSKCNKPTQNPFWKHPTDVNSGVKTRNQINKSHFATEQYMDFYFHYRANEQKSNLPDEQDKL